MKSTRSRIPKDPDKWPQSVSVGRASITVYRRKRGDGSFGFEVANYVSGKRRLESFPTSETALNRADDLARQLSERDVVAASMTNEQASDYAAAIQALAPFGVPLPATASTVAECLNLVGDLPNLHAAAKFYAGRNRQVSRKRVSGVVTELLSVKESRGASPRYIEDLWSRLSRFGHDFQKDTCTVTTVEIQGWLDQKKTSTQNYMNFRRVLHLLFEFAVNRGYATDNPVVSVAAWLLERRYPEQWGRRAMIRHEIPKVEVANTQTETPPAAKFTPSVQKAYREKFRRELSAELQAIKQFSTAKVSAEVSAEEVRPSAGG